MLIRRLTAALAAAALVVGVAGTALADHNTNVPGAVYSDDHARGFNKDHGKIREDLEKFGVRDVDPGFWAAGPITVLIEAGLMAPDESGNVNPTEEMEVGETVALFAKLLGVAGKDDTAEESLNKAREVGLVDEGSTPDAPMTRLEAARMIAVALGIKPRPFVTRNTYPFGDFHKVSVEDAALLAALYDLGVFKGYEDRTFRPDRTLTVAEIAALIDRILGAFAE